MTNSPIESYKICWLIEVDNDKYFFVEVYCVHVDKVCSGDWTWLMLPAFWSLEIVIVTQPLTALSFAFWSEFGSNSHLSLHAILCFQQILSG